MIGEIAAALARVRFADLPEAAQSKLRLLILANMCVAVAGVPEVKLPRPAPGGNHALFGGGRTTRAEDAAGFNAAAMHARTQDDFHPVGNLHLATVILPAVFAAAEAEPCSGETLLDAVAAGYMMAVALSRPGSVITTPKGLRSTGIYTPFGATAAVGRVLGLDTAQLGSALAITASLACGITQCWADGSDEWQLHVATAAETGLRACTLARHGFVGGAHALDGKAGFFQAFLGKPVGFDAIAADLAGGQAITETIMKRYPVSGICQPLTFVTERMLAGRALDPASVARVEIGMNPFEMRYSGTLNKGPFHSFSDVLMSAAYCCSAVLRRGTMQFPDLMNRNDPEIARLIRVTTVQEDATLPLMSARVRVVMRDGSTIADEARAIGNTVSIGWDDVDGWGAALWGDPAGYADCRRAVEALGAGPADGLIATFRK